MVAEVFGSDLVVFTFLSVVIPIWAIVDALSRPAVAFYGAGSNKTAWVMVLVVTTFLGLGLLLGAYYLLAVRGAVRRQMGRFRR
jgi:hypothetical protein